MTRKTLSRLSGFCTALVLGLSTPAGAQELISASPDITIGLSSGDTVSDEQAAVDNQLGVMLTETYGALPVSADIVALSQATNGDALIAFDTTLSLAGGVVAGPGDVVRFNGSTYSTEFDASAEGVPAGVRTDAVSISSSGLVMSFDTTTSLPGGITVSDEDLVRWVNGTYSIVMDGSSVGLDSSLDIDAVHDLGGGAFAISLDTTGTAGGIVFSDEDLMRWDGSAWSLEYDASAADSDWVAADMNAVVVPEPGFGALLLAGAAGLFTAVRRANRG